MKIVVQVRLFPDDTQQAALRETMHLCNRPGRSLERAAVSLPNDPQAWPFRAKKPMFVVPLV